jgi:hypothetical protein
LESFTDPVSISDYDAFCFDPDIFSQQLAALSDTIGPNQFNTPYGPHGCKVQEAIRRRRGEISELLERKGGLVLCLLRPDDMNFTVSGSRGNLPCNKYALVNDLDSDLNSVLGKIKAGTGQSIKVLDSRGGAAQVYLQVLKGHLAFHAHFGPWTDVSSDRTVLAENSVGAPIAVEFNRAAGKVCFVPVASDVTGERLGAAVVQTLDRFFAGDLDMPEPAWAASAVVPGVTVHEPQISDLKQKLNETARQIENLEHQRQRLLDYKKLLFGYGKTMLEPVVRASFREFGLVVPEPDEYPQDWDAHLTHEDSRTAIAEVEGAEGIVDVWKYRQLLDYVDAEAQEGRMHKGILVGNGFRLHPLEAPERNTQFSDHVIRGSQRNSFCLLPTTELFKAVCAVLENPQDIELRKTICDSLFSTVGPWAFVR